MTSDVTVERRIKKSVKKEKYVTSDIWGKQYFTQAPPSECGRGPDCAGIVYKHKMCHSTLHSFNAQAGYTSHLCVRCYPYCLTSVDTISHLKSDNDFVQTPSPNNLGNSSSQKESSG